MKQRMEKEEIQFNNYWSREGKNMTEQKDLTGSKPQHAKKLWAKRQSL
jgi:hypothetical protein